MDMIGDKNLLVAMSPSDSDSQKWEIAPLGDGHSIRNMKTKKYLSLVSIAREAPIVACNFPAAWYMRKIYVVEEDATYFE
ncbi:carbohydrate-binding module family 13 protein [Hydnomerulius pinastri MD-312]|uniref:Carbohydrate-binding module family 13 protein n=1 Tax=Hydnomerulius pinastri MD-312 TaxID=994086 RepID=A0A0C9W4E2_9AGAM|nr:carbohydrate-binding module family 13 protein [Hydnomerulius pinastri MD-312]